MGCIETPRSERRLKYPLAFLFVLGLSLFVHSATAATGVSQIDADAAANIGLNACGSNDLIMASDFEAPGDYQLNFTSNPSGLITAQGQAVQFTVEYLGPNAQPADASNLEWCLEDGTLLDIAPSGTTATVTATGFDITSVDVIVRDPTTNASARGIVLLAKLNPDAVIIEDDWVLSGATPGIGSTSIIRLPRNAATEAYTVGTIIASGPGAGVLVRVIGIALYANHIDFEVEPAALSDLFESLDIDAQGESIAYRVEFTGDGVAEVSQLDDQGRVTKKALDFARFKCNLSGLELKASLPSVSYDIRIDPDFVFRIDWFSVEKLGVEVTTTERAYFHWGGVTIDVSPAFACEVPFFTIPTPAQFPIGPLVLGIGVEPKVGFELKATAPSLSVTELQLPSLSGSRTSRSGFLLDSTGFNSIGGSDPAPKWQMDEGLTPKDQAEISVEFKPFIGLDTKLTLNNYGLVRLLALELGVPFKLDWNGPFDYTHRDYQGPSWTLDLAAELKWGLDEGELNSFLSPFRGFSVTPIKFSTATPIWSSALNLMESPSLSMSLTCDPANCFLDPATGGFLSWEASTDDPAWFVDKAKLDLVGWRDGAQQSELLVDDKPFVAGKSGGTWVPDATRLGQWDLAGLLNIDPISNWRPYVVRGPRVVSVGTPPLCTSFLQGPDYWEVSCLDSEGRRVRSELMRITDNDEIADGKFLGRIWYWKFDESGLDEDSGFYEANIIIGETVPLTFESGPVLLDKRRAGLLSDGTNVMKDYFYGQIDSSLGYTLTSLANMDHIDQVNYTRVTRRCIYQNSDFQSFVEVFENNVVVSQSSEPILRSQCPTMEEGDALGSLRLEDLIIYQCVQMGKTFNNCPLAPMN